MVWQLQLARHHNAVPLTRDYVTEADWAETGVAAPDRSLVHTTSTLLPI
jgi:hypothetical protein